MTAQNAASGRPVEQVFLCPLCAWRFEPPQREEPVDVAGVAAVLDMPAEAFASVREQQRRRRVEAYLHEHLRKHSLEEWATEVRRLRDLLAEVGVHT